MAMTITMKSLVSSKVSAVGDVILSWFAKKYFCASSSVNGTFKSSECFASQPSCAGSSVNGTFFLFCGGLCFLIALVMRESLRVAPTSSSNATPPNQMLWRERTWPT